MVFTVFYSYLPKYYNIYHIIYKLYSINNKNINKTKENTNINKKKMN